ncbi:MAG: hypothetical protein A2017_18495 [Lentisphaerae bacterium GWF2_44_16]|nr:MAG: hypothetical protein A2017_18495 [Lentisphaerae bacterium GWF2_44_16]
MKQNTVKTSACICWITGFILFLATGFLIGAMFIRPLLIAGIFLLLVSALCYLWTPESFEISDDLRLTVNYRSGKKEFGSVVKCYRLPGSICCGIRLCGNGGLFAATGLFWDRKYGKFWVYSTSANYKDFVMVETADKKIIISPENPDVWISDCALLIKISG